MSILSFLKFIGPFIWELILGKQTVKDAVKTNKKKVLFFALVIASVAFNLWSVQRLGSLGKAYVDLEHKCVPLVTAGTSGDIKPEDRLPEKASPKQKRDGIDEQPSVAANKPTQSPVATPKPPSDDELKSDLIEALAGRHRDKR